MPRKLLCYLLVLIGLAGFCPAQDVATDAPPPNSPEAVSEPVDPALAFLARVETKNAETQALQAKFIQERLELGLLDRVVSEGEFWYQAPDKFRADYSTDNSSTIWMIEGQLITYVPGLKQVDIISLPTGDDAPIHQLLLGFGVKVDEIRKLFDVTLVSRNPEEDQIVIRFASRDLSRSMEYATITITFSITKVEPLKIVLEDEESRITVDLKNVQLNPEIPESKFVATWPDDTNVMRYQGQ